MRVTLHQLVDGRDRWRAAGLLTLSVLAGGLSALLPPILVEGVEAQLAGEATPPLALAYLVALVSAWALRQTVPSRLAALVESKLAQLRRRLFTRMRTISLRSFERETGAMEAFSRDLETLAQLPRVVERVVLGGVMVLGLSAYLLTLSPLAFAAWLLMSAAMAVALAPELRASMDLADDQDQSWSALQRDSELLLAGWELLKVDGRAATALLAELERDLGQLSHERVERDLRQRDLELKADIGLLAALGALMFLLPMSIELEPGTILALVTLLVIAEGALAGILKQSHFLLAGEVAWRNLMRWEASLEVEQGTGAPVSARPTFESLELREVEFAYGTEGFVLGPLDLRLERGELLFIQGANGSGKTTLMKLMCGLYPPARGELRLNGARVDVDALEGYRALFTVLFTDHHVFERSYGLSIADPAQVDALLERFALDDVVQWRDGVFSPLELSTGQAKRLSMVVALLEDRPVVVLDEWAAHQDPQLRRFYYEQLLPGLKQRGKTIVAISHDDRFFDQADRVLSLERGQLRRDTLA